MRVVTGLDAFPRPPRRAVVAVGVFDGIHLAHQQVIRTLTRRARRLGGTSVVITFDPDPVQVLDPPHAQPSLMPLAARIDRFAALGVERVWIIPFTRTFARMSASAFVRRILLSRLRAEALIVGDAFVFGRNRQGNMELLTKLGAAHGMRVIPVPAVTRGGAIVSSSRIRRLISRGELRLARRLLGRAPAIYGTVVRGAGRGRRLGFPTANLRLSSEVLPPRGVYAVTVHQLRDRKSSARRQQRGVTPPPIGGAVGLRPVGGGVMNLGIRPTFGPGRLTCEVHLLDFSGTLRGRHLSLSLAGRLRGERRFPSGAALSAQVARDITRARRILSRSR